MPRSRTGGLRSEINVTPLVDVVLVLLIILMMIAPLAMHGYDVDIAKSGPAARPSEPPDKPIVLAIDVASCPAVDPPASAGLPHDCRVRIHDEVLPVPELAARAAQLFAARDPAQRVLFLAVGRELNYEAVLRIVDVAKSAVDGLRIGLVTPQRESSGPR